MWKLLWYVLAVSVPFLGSVARELAELWPGRGGDRAKSLLSYGEASWGPPRRWAGWLGGGERRGEVGRYEGRRASWALIFGGSIDHVSTLGWQS